MDKNSPVEKEFRLQETQKKALQRLGIKSLFDLLYHFPTRYGDTSEIKNIGSLEVGELAVVFGTLSGLKASKGFRTKITMATGKVRDESGSIKSIWFNQPYLAKMIGDESLVRIEGKVSERKKDGELYFSNPKVEKVEKLPLGVGNSLFGSDGEEHALYPVYPESRGITSNWMYHAIQKLFSGGIIETLVDPIPEEILSKYNLPTLQTALIWIHAPKKTDDALAARKRFAFEEVFFIQLEKQRAKQEYQKNPTYPVTVTPEDVENFTGRFPFKPTAAQDRAIKTIIENFRKEQAMSRLLEGDVGSGKTLVAAVTAFSIATSRPLKRPEGAFGRTFSQGENVLAKHQNFGNLQVAYMAPTEILATQHFESFIQYFKHLPVQIGLITGSGCRKFPSKINPLGSTPISRTQLIKWVANGEIPILIGTHALIQKSVRFKHLAYAIIDEQHRFGVNQRRELVQKEGRAPHLLSMTATPIPRTLALTIFGDLDLTLLDEQPPGRKPIITSIVPKNKREEIYEEMRIELKKGRQAYVICPRIDEPDPSKEMALLAKSVKAEAERLKKTVFKEFEIGVLHSKMKSDEKDAIMKNFSLGKIHILCATSVVEVGVNVPNATVIVIEGAERFGLAQLHQLRGRVLRSTHQAYCYVFTESAGEKTSDRLNALQTAKNGFELAELDLKFRGSGTLSGGKQWGVSDLAMEALQNLKMVEAARTEAGAIIEKDPDLKTFPLLKEKISKENSVHFE